MKKTVLILGSSGLTGSIVLDKLLKNPNYEQIVAIVRKKQNIINEKLVEIVTDFDKEIDLSSFEKIDSVFSCLGTTLRKTPKQKDYRKIEIDIPLYFAQLAQAKNIEKFHYISSVGANSNSSNFYLKMKGEAEESLEKTSVKVFNIYRPSLLLGNRKEKRPVEKISSILFKIINPLLRGKLSKYQSMNTENLARSMVSIDLKEQTNKVNIFTYNEIMENQY